MRDVAVTTPSWGAIGLRGHHVRILEADRIPELSR